MSDSTAREGAAGLGAGVDRPAGPFTELFRAVGRRELFIVLAVFLVAFVAMTSVKVIKIGGLLGDSAIFAQLTENVAQRGVPVSQLFANTQAFLDGNVLHETAAEIANDPLTPPAIPERNILTFHFYTILYPIGALARIVPATIVLPALFMLSCFGLIVCAYLMLRAKRVPVVGAALFCLLAISHPAWGETLWGQFYPDRLFMLAGFLLFYVTAHERTTRTTLIVTALVCAMIGERAALIGGIFMIAYGLLYRNEVKDRAIKLGTGAAMIVFALAISKLVIANAYYGRFLPTNVAGIMANFEGATAHKTALFVLVNVLLLALALFDRRAALIAVILMLPNLLGTIGGAEKIGWTTHYHSYYLPALVWASARGFAVLCGLAAAQRRLPAAFAAVAVLALGMSMIDPSSAANINVGPANLSNHVVIQATTAAQVYISPGGMQLDALQDDVRKAVPEGSVVAMNELMMHMLYHNRTIRVMPVDIDRADYAILNVIAKTGNTMTYGGMATYLGPEEQKKIDDVVVARMRKDGYDFAHPVFFPSFSVAIVKRIHR